MLLDTKLFKPYKTKGSYFRQDEVIIYYDYWTNNWEIFINKQIISGEYECDLIIALSDILKDLKENEYIVCFINDLGLAMAMFPGGEIQGYKKDSSNKEHPIYYTTKHIQFRNFSLFHISGKGRGVKSSSQMYEYLISLANKFGRDTINSCQYTIGWVSERILTFGLDKNILDWYAENHNYVDSVQEYEDQLIGCKTGLLKAMKGVHKNVLMIDLKSAYLSSFLHYNKFPIGRDRKHTGLSAVINFIEGKAYHIVVETDEIYDSFENWKQGNAYGFYDLDNEFFKIQNIDLEGWIFERLDEGCTIRAYSNQKYGELMPEILERCCAFSRMKEAATGEDRDAIKTMTEMIYGKALQSRKFDTDKECYKHFLRPEHYMRPKYSMIACAYVRLKMLKMINKLGGSYYHDTDGIETEFSPVNARIVVAENKKIEKFNEENNIPLQLGTWQIESLHADILIITRKQRMFYDDYKKLRVKVAGINQEYINKYIHQNRPMDVFETFNKPVKIPIPGAFMHIDGYGFVNDEVKEVLLGKED